MLNSNIINSICQYISNPDIVRLHKITKFYPNIKLWDKRLVKEVDGFLRESDLKVEEFIYIVKRFPVRRVSIGTSHIDEFYSNLCNLTYFESNPAISNAIFTSIIKRSENIEDLVIDAREFDLSYLESRKKIRSLTLKVGEISNISYLANFDLEELSLSSSNFDMSLIHDYQKIKKLCLSLCNITSISLLPNYKNLVILDLSRNQQLFDISLVENCKELKELNLHRTHVSDLSALGSCHKLETLFISGTLVSDISPLEGCQNLNKLYARGVFSLQDFLPLANCKKLRVLMCSPARITQQQRNHLLASIPGLHIA
jgi:internalin A